MDSQSFNGIETAVAVVVFAVGLLAAVHVALG